MFNRKIILATTLMICLMAFIRIDRKAAMEKLYQFFSDNNFTSLQKEYLKTIITYVSDYGDISLETLVNEFPFDEYEWIDTFG